jgi:hypothetical protein
MLSDLRSSEGWLNRKGNRQGRLPEIGGMEGRWFPGISKEERVTVVVTIQWPPWKGGQITRPGIRRLQSLILVLAQSL